MEWCLEREVSLGDILLPDEGLTNAQSKQSILIGQRLAELESYRKQVFTMLNQLLVSLSKSACTVILS